MLNNLVFLILWSHLSQSVLAVEPPLLHANLKNNNFAVFVLWILHPSPLNTTSVALGERPGCTLLFKSKSGFHTHIQAAHEITLFNLECPSLELTERMWQQEADGGGAKSSIIYGWNPIKGRSLDGNRYTGRYTESLRARH